MCQGGETASVDLGDTIQSRRVGDNIENPDLINMDEDRTQGKESFAEQPAGMQQRGGETESGSSRKAARQGKKKSQEGKGFHVDKEPRLEKKMSEGRTPTATPPAEKRA